jgi:serine-type D-Ala-D-Ala carboxypeptidase (penicillin-binding protein 5/6)
MHRWFLCVVCLVCLTGVAGGQTLGERLQPLISGHEGDVAVAVKHLTKAESFAHQADEPMPTASLIKLPIMVEAYRQAAAGQINLNDVVTFREEDKTPGSGILSTQFSAGATFTVRDAIRLMIAYSDNSATNLVRRTPRWNSWGFRTPRCMRLCSGRCRRWLRSVAGSLAWEARRRGR